MASPFLATIDETPDSAYPRLVEGRESRRSVQAAVGDEINSLVSGGGREIENENSPKEDTVPNRLWHRGQPSTRDRKRVCLSYGGKYGGSIIGLSEGIETTSEEDADIQIRKRSSTRRGWRSSRSWSESPSLA
ncbi:hypothetical protein U1Q18_041280 [Sarracenia purpurea var. burkii]